MPIRIHNPDGCHGNSAIQVTTLSRKNFSRIQSGSIVFWCMMVFWWSMMLMRLGTAFGLTFSRKSGGCHLERVQHFISLQEHRPRIVSTNNKGSAREVGPSFPRIGNNGFSELIVEAY
uniref:(northern house mosquito) hypothetical protein n=1 Tax=Culex pipiens TaxID=7175 RepID=A0A8D8MM14_CULPI